MVQQQSLIASLHSLQLVTMCLAIRRKSILLGIFIFKSSILTHFGTMYVSNQSGCLGEPSRSSELGTEKRRNITTMNLDLFVE
jgi:hypothetical protein